MHLLFLRFSFHTLRKLLLPANLAAVTLVFIIDGHLHCLQVVPSPRLGRRLFRVRLRYFQNF